MLTKDELLKPRYKVIADYPGSTYFIGDIIRGAHLIQDEYNKYPHLFKPLAWYEGIKKKDMPEYLRTKLGGVIKVTYGSTGRRRFEAGYGINEDGMTIEYTKMLPATEEEYLAYKKAKI